jgi:predicted nucleic acid-binding protein
VIDVVSDANVALKWFHSAGEEGVEESRALLSAHRERLLAIHLLDLTLYEVGNTLLRGGAGAGAAATATVLQAMREVCPIVALTSSDQSLAADLAAEHGLTFYDAAYAWPRSTRSSSTQASVSGRASWSFEAVRTGFY